MKEITELKDKYLVLKEDDLDRFFSQFTKGVFTTKKEQGYINKISFNTVLKEIQAYRQSIGKKDNRYVILNLDDEIDLDYLIKSLEPYQKLGRKDYYTIKVDRLAVAIVNAILKAKEKE